MYGIKFYTTYIKKKNEQNTKNDFRSPLTADEDFFRGFFRGEPESHVYSCNKIDAIAGDISESFQLPRRNVVYYDRAAVNG